MGGVEICWKVMYEGEFYMERRTKKFQMMYKRGHVQTFKDIDTDCVSMVAIKNTFEEETRGVKVRELWYVLRGKSYDDGLVRIENDEMAVDMMKHTDVDGVVSIIVVQSKEVSPVQLHISAELQNMPHCLKIVYGQLELICFPELVAQQPTPHPTPTPIHESSPQETPQLAPETIPGQENFKDINEDVFEKMSEGESSEDIDEFRELDGEDGQLNDDILIPREDEKRWESSSQVIANGEDELTEATIRTESGDEALSEAVRVENEQGYQSESEVVERGNNVVPEKYRRKKFDYLVSDFQGPNEAPLDDYNGFYCGEDSNDSRFPRFNTEIDFTKEIELVSGMIFPSRDVFRKALRIHSIYNGGDYYYLHNDCVRVTAYCLHKCECPIVHSRKKCTCNNGRCQFEAFGRRISDDGTFQLKTFNGKHDCGFQQKNTIVKRIRVEGIQVKCSNCHQTGHNKRSCKNEKSTEPAFMTATNKLTRGRPKDPNKVVFGAQKRKYTKALFGCGKSRGKKILRESLMKEMNFFFIKLSSIIFFPPLFPTSKRGVRGHHTQYLQLQQNK